VSAAEVLEANGFGGDRLLKLSRKIAGDELRRRGVFLDHERFEDLVAFLALAGVRSVVRYDPARHHASYGKNGGDPFASWLADVLAHRVTDWYRSKAEGMATDAMATMAASSSPAMISTTRRASRSTSSVSSRRIVSQWREAADLVGLSLAEFIVMSLDPATQAVKRAASSSVGEKA
jgi:hypothetical protein